MAKRKIPFTDAKRKIYELDAEMVAYYRRNPCIACEDLLGIKLLDSQKYILQQSWNTPHVLWCCSRDFGKSFLGAILMILTAILFENQAIYIVSSVGNQSKETFTKLEEIVLRLGKTAASIRSLKDIVEGEVVKSPTNKTGFSHNPMGYHVKFWNGSEIFTLNGNPDNNRSRRASMVFFDEAAFCSDELISVCEAFAAQDSDFVTSVEEDYDPETEPRRRPTQLVYASSQSEMDKMFYKHYRTFAKAMLAGDRNYFVCDMICETAIQTYMNGRPYKALLTKDKVETALKANKEKALREYYNKPEQDGGANQIVKWGTIRRNERFHLPQLYHEPNSRIVLAFDPARTIDNSILSAMKLIEDPELGLCGMIVNCVNMVDTATKRKFKLDSVRQISELQQTLLNYNGQSPDYEHISMLLIDQGAGGGGTSTYADGLLANWNDRAGKEHRGLIDKSHEIYEGFDRRYPDAVDKLRLISPRKYRTQMVDEFIELMNLGVIWFPYEYSGQGGVLMPDGVINGEEIFRNRELNEEEQLALVNIDLMKKEITSIYKFENQERTSRTYALSKDKENKMHDDRFYTAIMLAHYLYELRRGHITRRPKPVFIPDEIFEFRAPKLRSS